MEESIENKIERTSRFRKIAEKLYYTFGVNIVGIRNFEKKPIKRWGVYHTERQTENEAFDLRWHLLTGLGIILGPVGNVYAIDVDKPESIDVAYAILDLLGLTKDYAWFVKTGGGYHIYYKSQDLLKHFNGQKVKEYKESEFPCKQIELRINCLITAPGSLHKSGNKYEFINSNDFDKEMAFIEPAVILALAKRLTPVEEVTTAPSPSDTSSTSEPTIETIPNGFDQETFDSVTDCIDQLREKGLQPAMINNYSSWIVNALFPIGNEFGERGRSLFHALSRLSVKYNEEKCDEFYTNYLKGNHDYKKNKRRIGSLFYMFKQLDIRPRINRTAELEPVKNNAYFSTVEILLKRHNIRRETFTDTIYFDGRPLDDRALNTAVIYLTSKYNFQKINKDFIASLCESDYIEEYHRITDLVENHIPKNPTGNLKKITDSLITNTGAGITVTWREQIRPLKDVLIELFMVKMVKQFYELIANDFCLVLLGDMHVGKTYWLTHLLPEQINDLVRITQFSNDKDFKVQLCESALLVIDEIREKDMSSNEFMKMTMSMPQFSLRVPYGRKPKMRKRIASLAGTGNNMFILRDPAGNRRFIPFWLELIDKDLFNSVDKMDLFHEVYTLYKSGYDTKISDQLLNEISNLSKDFEVRTEADEILLDLCPPSDPKSPYSDLLSVAQMKDLILDRIKKNLNFYQVGMAVDRLGYVGKTDTHRTYNGKISKVWKYYCDLEGKLRERKIYEDPFSEPLPDVTTYTPENPNGNELDSTNQDKNNSQPF